MYIYIYTYTVVTPGGEEGLAPSGADVQQLASGGY